TLRHRQGAGSHRQGGATPWRRRRAQGPHRREPLPRNPRAQDLRGCVGRAEGGDCKAVSGRKLMHELGPSAHTDTFARDNLPPRDQWSDFLLDGFDYPERLNAAVELTDRLVEKGFGDRTALIG